MKGPFNGSIMLQFINNFGKNLLVFETITPSFSKKVNET